MLALVASIHLLNTALGGEDVDGRGKPDHDGLSQAGRAGSLSESASVGVRLGVSCGSEAV